MGQAAASPRAQIVRPSTCLLQRTVSLGKVCSDNLRELKEHINLASMSAAFHHTIHHVHHPRRALSAGRALPTRFMFVELVES
jgi:hypothetical protein